MQNKFAVIGLGRFGTTIAVTLAQRGAEVLAIDLDEDRVEQISDEVAYAVAMDATDMKALQAQNIEDMDGVVVAIGENFEALLLCTVQLLDLPRRPRIITRSSTATQKMILEKLGITEILSPEDEVGFAVAQRLLNPDLLTFLQLPDEYEIVEINCPPGASNKTLSEIRLRERYNINLITIKRRFEEMEKGQIVEQQHIIGVPKADTVIFKNDNLILMGKNRAIDRFIELNR
jgi:trk system potassium uptake protein TrkA